MLALTARLYPSALDQRRGIVRLHPDALAALGLAPWDVVLLQGRRTTGGLVAVAPPGTGQHELLCDELVLGNMGVPSGTVVQASAAPTGRPRRSRSAGPRRWWARWTPRCCAPPCSARR